MAPHKKKTSLKATLQSQQARLRANEKAAHAAKLADQRRRDGRRPAPASQAQPKRRPATVPFKPTDHILLLGEGNFAFARALVVDPPPPLAHLPPAHVTATSYDAQEVCFAKYPDAEAIVRTIRERGVAVVFGVDATRLQAHAALKGRRWDRIVWNFPHAGKGITDRDRNILSNQRLMLDFFCSAPHCLALGPIPDVQPRKRKSQDDDDDPPEDEDTRTRRGTVLITLRNVPPYTEWDIPRLAKSPPKPTKLGDAPNPRYKLLRSFAFHRDMWKGYEHRMTKGERAHGQGKTGEGGEDRTWEFCLLDE